MWLSNQPSGFSSHGRRDAIWSPLGVVRKPRHPLVYRRSGDVIEVLRVLHDARDIERRLARLTP